MPDEPSDQPQPATRNGSPWRSVAAVVALLAMAPVGFYYALSGLVATVPGVYGLWLLYAVFLWIAVRLARRRSLVVLAVPPVAAAAWIALLQAGAQWWGWQA